MTQCETKTYNVCDGTTEKTCMELYPKMDGCVNKGLMMAEDSGARVPNIFRIDDLNY